MAMETGASIAALPAAAQPEAKLAKKIVKYLGIFFSSNLW
jgi:hypothetical protein